MTGTRRSGTIKIQRSFGTVALFPPSLLNSQFQSDEMNFKRLIQMVVTKSVDRHFNLKGRSEMKKGSGYLVLLPEDMI